MTATVEVFGDILRDSTNESKRNYVNLQIVVKDEERFVMAYHLTNYAPNAATLLHRLTIKSYTSLTECDRAYTEKRMAKEELIDKVAPASSPATTTTVSSSSKKDEPRPLMQYVAKLIRKGDKELWRKEMSAIIRKFKFDQDTQKRLVAAATTLAKSSHPLNNAFVPESR